MALTAIALSCSLRRSGDAPGSTQRMISGLADALATHDVTLAGVTP
jgi:hypothetical protein